MFYFPHRSPAESQTRLERGDEPVNSEQLHRLRGRLHVGFERPADEGGLHRVRQHRRDQGFPRQGIRFCKVSLIISYSIKCI